MRGTLYTSGSWWVKAGREDEFVAAWHEIAEWTVAEFDGAVWATLLRDIDDPTHFISFGPWESMEAIRHWRASDGFQERVAGHGFAQVSGAAGLLGLLANLGRVMRGDEDDRNVAARLTKLSL